MNSSDSEEEEALLMQSLCFQHSSKQAKAKGWPYASAFIDISKVNDNQKFKCLAICLIQAYDSIWHPALLLVKLGFGGENPLILTLIKSMYKNNSLRFMINGHYTDQLWLSKGVKQGNTSSSQAS